MPEDVDLELVADRLEFLEHLTGIRQHKPTIVEELGHSRSTVDRAIRALENEGLVERTAEGFTTTLKGRLAADQYRETVSKSADVFAVGDALNPLPATAEIAPAAVAGAEVCYAKDPLAHEPISAIGDLIDESDRLHDNPGVKYTSAGTLLDPVMHHPNAYKYPSYHCN